MSEQQKLPKWLRKAKHVIVVVPVPEYVRHLVLYTHYSEIRMKGRKSTSRYKKDCYATKSIDKYTPRIFSSTHHATIEQMKPCTVESLLIFTNSYGI